MDHMIKYSSTSSHHRIKHHKNQTKSKNALLQWKTNQTTSLIGEEGLDTAGEKLLPDLEMKIGFRQREIMVRVERDG